MSNGFCIINVLNNHIIGRCIIIYKLYRVYNYAHISKTGESVSIYLEYNYYIV